MRYALQFLLGEGKLPGNSFRHIRHGPGQVDQAGDRLERVVDSCAKVAESRPAAASSSALRMASWALRSLGKIAENQHYSDQLTAIVPNWRRAIVNCELLPVARNQYGVVGQTYDFSLA